MWARQNFLRPQCDPRQPSLSALQLVLIIDVYLVIRATWPPSARHRALRARRHPRPLWIRFPVMRYSVLRNYCNNSIIARRGMVAPSRAMSLPADGAKARSGALIDRSSDPGSQLRNGRGIRSMQGNNNNKYGSPLPQPCLARRSSLARACVLVFMRSPFSNPRRVCLVATDHGWVAVGELPASYMGCARPD